MTAQELLDIIRADYLDDGGDDLADPDDVEDAARWKTPFLLREIGRAQVEATHRQDLRHLFDDSTTAICRVALAEGVASYAVDRRILRIARAQIVGCALALEHFTEAQLDERRPGWRLDQAGTPEAFLVMGRSLVLYPAPNATAAAAGLALAVWREPLLTALTAADTLEWSQDQEKLAHWVAGRAFLRPDEGTFDAKLAAAHLAQFDAAFGSEVRAQARAELFSYPGSVAMNWSGGGRRGRVTSRGGAWISGAVPSTPAVPDAPEAGGPYGRRGSTWEDLGLRDEAEADEAILAGQPVCILPSTHAVLADAAAAAGRYEVLGLALAAAQPGHAVPYGDQQVELADWTPILGAATLTPGAPVFLDPTAPGRLTHVAPETSGAFCVRVGRALSATTIQIDIEPPIRL